MRVLRYFSTKKLKVFLNEDWSPKGRREIELELARRKKKRKKYALKNTMAFLSAQETVQGVQ